MTQVPEVIIFPRSMRDILAETAADHGVSIADLMGPSQKWKHAHPRQDFMWRCYQARLPNGQRKYSTPQIGDFLARDHSTVLHGVKAHEVRLRAGKARAA